MPHNSEQQPRPTFLFHPPEEVAREEGRAINLFPMFHAAKMILQDHIQLPEQFTPASIEQLLHRGLATEVGGEHVDEDMYIEPKPWTVEAVAHQFAERLESGEFEYKEHILYQAALEQLQEQVQHMRYLSEEMRESFVEGTEFPIADFVMQRLHPIVTSSGSIYFFREIHRDIPTSKTVAELFGEEYRKEAVLFLLNGIDQHIAEKIGTGEVRSSAAEALSEVANKFDIDLYGSRPEYLTIMRLMNDGSLRSQIFHRLLRVRVFVEDLSIVTERWINHLVERARQQELSQFVDYLFQRGGMAAVEELARAQFGPNVHKVEIRQVDKNGQITVYDKRSLIIGLWKYPTEKKQLKDPQTRQVLEAITSDLVTLNAVTLAHYTPQAFQWLLEGMDYGWNPDRDDPFDQLMRFLAK